MKYAFIGKSQGTIKVNSAVRGNTAVTSISDDGCGIPDSVTFENFTGLGFQLVWMLTKQLDGTIRIERGNGTKIILEFLIKITLSTTAF